MKPDYHIYKDKTDGKIKQKCSSCGNIIEVSFFNRPKCWFNILLKNRNNN